MAQTGFTSNYGVGIVTDVMTGLVLDYEAVKILPCMFFGREEAYDPG